MFSRHKDRQQIKVAVRPFSSLFDDRPPPRERVMQRQSKIQVKHQDERGDVLWFVLQVSWSVFSSVSSDISGANMDCRCEPIRQNNWCVCWDALGCGPDERDIRSATSEWSCLHGGLSLLSAELNLVFHFHLSSKDSACSHWAKVWKCKESLKINFRNDEAFTFGQLEGWTTGCMSHKDCSGPSDRYFCALFSASKESVDALPFWSVFSPLSKDAGVHCKIRNFWFFASLLRESSHRQSAQHCTQSNILWRKQHQICCKRRNRTLNSTKDMAKIQHPRDFSVPAGILGV